MSDVKQTFGNSCQVQPTPGGGFVLTLVVSSQDELGALLALIDRPDYKTTRRWRGRYLAMVRSITNAIQAVTGADANVA